MSRTLSVPEGVVRLQTTAGFTQRKDVQQRERERKGENEKEIRPSPLNIYALGPHRFLTTFFAVFRRVGGGDSDTHTQACMFIDTFSYSHIHLLFLQRVRWK